MVILGSKVRSEATPLLEPHCSLQCIKEIFKNQHVTEVQSVPCSGMIPGRAKETGSQRIIPQEVRVCPHPAVGTDPLGPMANASLVGGLSNTADRIRWQRRASGFGSGMAICASVARQRSRRPVALADPRRAPRTPPPASRTHLKSGVANESGCLP